MRLLYLQIERFPIQRHVIETAGLAGKPIAFLQVAQGQQKIVVASSAAMAAGVRPGTTLAAAMALIPTLRHFPYRPEVERAALMSLAEALLLIAPSFQLCPTDGLWLDASAAPLCGSEEGLCERALEICARRGYQARAVVASEAFTAQALARHTPKRMQVVPPRGAAHALAALPLDALKDVDAAAVATLRSLGLSTLGEVVSLPPAALLARLGPSGQLLHRLCRGDERASYNPTALPEILDEAIDLDWPAESLEPLLFALKTTVDRLCARLAGRRRAAVRLVLSLKLEEGSQVQTPIDLTRASARAKLIHDLVKHQLAELTFSSPIVALRLRVEHSCEDGGTQLTLGDEPEGDASLDVVLSRLSSVLGKESLFSAEVQSNHRPEAAYSPKGFHPPAAKKGLLGEAAREAHPLAPVDECLVQRPSRLLDPAVPLSVELDREGDLRSARVLGKQRKVLALSAPERACGEWWTEARYDRDYYRVYFDGFGPAWIFRDARDGRFYLQGMFD